MKVGYNFSCIFKTTTTKITTLIEKGSLWIVVVVVRKAMRGIDVTDVTRIMCHWQKDKQQLSTWLRPTGWSKTRTTTTKQADSKKVTKASHSLYRLFCLVRPKTKSQTGKNETCWPTWCRFVKFCNHHFQDDRAELFNKLAKQINKPRNENYFKDREFTQFASITRDRSK